MNMNIGDEIVVTKEEIDSMFLDGIIKESDIGWIYKDKYLIDIIAIHDTEIKYVNDIANTNTYKLRIYDKIENELSI